MATFLSVNSRKRFMQAPVSEVTVRDFREDDLRRIYEIEVLSFKYPWSMRAFIAVQNMGAKIVVAEHRNYGVIGFAIFRVERTRSAILGHLMNIAVHPEFRRKGIGSLLLRTFEEKCTSRGAEYAYLEVRISNTAAISFYKKHGYKIWGARKGYYSNGEDALIMIKRLR